MVTEDKAEMGTRVALKSLIQRPVLKWRQAYYYMMSPSSVYNKDDGFGLLRSFNHSLHLYAGADSKCR